MRGGPGIISLEGRKERLRRCRRRSSFSFLFCDGALPPPSSLLSLSLRDTPLPQLSIGILVIPSTPRHPPSPSTKRAQPPPPSAPFFFAPNLSRADLFPFPLSLRSSPSTTVSSSVSPVSLQTSSLCSFSNPSPSPFLLPFDDESSELTSSLSVAYSHEALRFRVNMYRMKEEREIGPETFCHMVSSTLYEKR